MEYYVAAIVGTSSTLKSTVGFRVSGRLSFGYCDVGLVWRLLAHKSMREGIEPEDEFACIEVCSSLTVVASGLGWVAEGGRLWELDELAAPGVATYASLMSRSNRLRDRMVPIIRGMYSGPGMVVVGRPFIHEKVFPAAFHRTLLHSPEPVRAGRNHDGETIREMLARDVRDGVRPFPSRPGHHATLPTEHYAFPELVRVISSHALRFYQMALERPVVPWNQDWGGGH